MCKDVVSVRTRLNSLGWTSITCVPFVLRSHNCGPCLPPLFWRKTLSGFCPHWVYVWMIFRTWRLLTFCCGFLNMLMRMRCNFYSRDSIYFGAEGKSCCSNLTWLVLICCCCARISFWSLWLCGLVHLIHLELHYRLYSGLLLWMTTWRWNLMQHFTIWERLAWLWLPIWWRTFPYCLLHSCVVHYVLLNMETLCFSWPLVTSKDFFFLQWFFRRIAKFCSIVG